MLPFFSKQVLPSFLNLFFPAACLHCRNSVDDGAFLCPSCSAQLQLIDPTTRCPLCFSDDIPHFKTRCSECRHKADSSYIDYLACCFDYGGALQSVIHQFKYKDAPYLARALSPFLFLQLEQLQWPKPDYITFIPQTFTRSLERGYNQSFLLAEELSTYINCPTISLLNKKGARLQQTQLERKGRQELLSQLFTLQKGKERSIEDKVLLLIDDVFTTGTTLQQAARALQTGHPKKIYALTLCRG